MKKVFSTILSLAFPLFTANCLGENFIFSIVNVSEPPLTLVSERGPLGAKFFTTMEIHAHSVKEGWIRGTVVNKFTLFSSVIPVIVYLYSSSFYTENVSEMVLEQSAFTPDLDMRNSLFVERPLNGEYKYWRARAVYYCDGKKSEIETETHLFLPSGISIPTGIETVRIPQESSQ